MAETCGNCTELLPVRRCHIHLSTHEVVEITLCEDCRSKFVAADWVTAVLYRRCVVHSGQASSGVSIASKTPSRSSSAVFFVPVSSTKISVATLHSVRHSVR